MMMDQHVPNWPLLWFGIMRNCRLASFGTAASYGSEDLGTRYNQSTVKLWGLAKVKVTVVQTRV